MHTLFLLVCPAVLKSDANREATTSVQDKSLALGKAMLGHGAAVGCRINLLS